jgi:hypothetical protein
MTQRELRSKRPRLRQPKPAYNSATKKPYVANDIAMGCARIVVRLGARDAHGSSNTLRSPASTSAEPVIPSALHY